MRKEGRTTGRLHPPTPHMSLRPRAHQQLFIQRLGRGGACGHHPHQNLSRNEPFGHTRGLGCGKTTHTAVDPSA